MALIRILVDGYSLLHGWPGVAPGQARHSATARDELIHVLTRYRDAAGVPLTIVFDGAGAPPGTPKAASSREMEVLFSGPGQTADDLIERAAHRFKPYGEVLVVTDDRAERETIQGEGALASSCENFIRAVEAALGDSQKEMEDWNRRERQAFQSAGRRSASH